MGNELLSSRLKSDQQKLKTIFKNLIKCCAGSALLLRKAKQSLLTLRREKIMRELNQN